MSPRTVKTGLSCFSTSSLVAHLGVAKKDMTNTDHPAACPLNPLSFVQVLRDFVVTFQKAFLVKQGKAGLSKVTRSWHEQTGMWGCKAVCFKQKVLRAKAQVSPPLQWNDQIWLTCKCRSCDPLQIWRLHCKDSRIALSNSYVWVHALIILRKPGMVRGKIMELHLCGGWVYNHIFDLGHLVRVIVARPSSDKALHPDLFRQTAIPAPQNYSWWQQHDTICSSRTEEVSLPLVPVAIGTWHLDLGKHVCHICRTLWPSDSVV